MKVNDQSIFFKQCLLILQNELVKNNQMMQSAGQSLAQETDKLIRQYHRQSNIQQTIEALSQAFPGTSIHLYSFSCLISISFSFRNLS